MPCYRTHDANGELVGILCGRLGPACVECGDVSSVLCDFPIGDESRTCDKPLCVRCAPTIGADKNYCTLHRENGPGLLLFPARKLTDAEIMEAAKAVLRARRAKPVPKAPAPEHRWRVVEARSGWAPRSRWQTELGARRCAIGGGVIQTWDQFVALWRQQYPLKPRGKPRPIPPTEIVLECARQLAARESQKHEEETRIE